MEGEQRLRRQPLDLVRARARARARARVRVRVRVRDRVRARVRARVRVRVRQPLDRELELGGRSPHISLYLPISPCISLNLDRELELGSRSDERGRRVGGVGPVG